MLTETFLTYGQPKAPAELIPLRAGPLTLLYDPASGMVRRITLGKTEVLRGIYAAVRDRNWGTVPGVIHETAREVDEQSFRIEFESTHRLAEIHFIWRGAIHGTADGDIRYEFDGEAKNTFLRNRIGFCVLHPIRECAGARARQFRIDGAEVECRFPELIEPQIFGRSSFQNLRAVAHEVADGVWVKCEFAGDTFEMEDQRNWTDASFKTYCTPLAVPFPVEIVRGTRVRQSVTLKLLESNGRESALTSPCLGKNELTHVGCYELTDGAHEVSVNLPSKPTHRLPSIGLGVASHGEELSADEIAALRGLKLAHLRVDLRLAQPDCIATLGRAAREAVALNTALELAVHLPREGTLDSTEFLRVLKSSGVRVARIFALREGEAATTPTTLATVRKSFRTLGAPIGAGSDCNFCELNREHALGRFALADADFVFWSINPQVHASDHLSILETLEAQAATVRTARVFAGNRPLIISPVTLKQRFNPVATGAVSQTPPGELPQEVDPRQLSRFAAAWTLGSIATLTSAGVESVTYFETTGWRGVMERAIGTELPDKFPSGRGDMFPVFNALKDNFGCGAGQDVFAFHSDRIALLGLYASGVLNRVVTANLDDTTRSVRIIASGVSDQFVRLKPYDADRLDVGMRSKK